MTPKLALLSRNVMKVMKMFTFLLYGIWPHFCDKKKEHRLLENAGCILDYYSMGII